MGFSTNSYAHIWNMEDKGNYHVAEMSISRKNKETDKYETEWSNKFVRLVGTAHEQAKTLDTSKNVKIGRCDVTNNYSKEKNTTYTNYVIFNFEDGNSGTSNSASHSQKSKDNFMDVSDAIDEELPFN